MRTRARCSRYSELALWSLGGLVPRNVATVCALTWMCQRGDIHADDDGYAVLAAAVVSRL